MSGEAARDGDGRLPVDARYTAGRWRDYADADLPAPLAAALDEFVRHGYHGTSVREIAARAGLSVPGLYYHYPSKQALLRGLLEQVMTDLLARSAAAVAEAGDRPIAQFDAVVESLLRFHMYRRGQAFIGSTEIRSLEPEYRAVFIGHRDRQQRMVDRIVAAGAESGEFATPYPRDAARAVTVMCVGVSTWYRRDGALAVDELVRRNLRIARDIVGYAGA